jgi:subtilisin family serine protease
MFTRKSGKNRSRVLSITSAAVAALLSLGLLRPAWGDPPEDEEVRAGTTHEERSLSDLEARQTLADARADAAELGTRASAAQPQDPAEEFVEGEILVGLRPGVPALQADAVRQALAATKIKEFAQIGVQHWRLPPGLTVEQAIRTLSANPNVEYAEANYIVHALDFPNDPRLTELWGLHNVGQTGGTLDADIDAIEAWHLQTGSASVVVGVIDTGIDYNHEDLAANMWVNTVEIPDNGIDDDGNGYIDDVRGWDFVNDDNDPTDDHGHGTHTAGTVGAVGDNGIGVVGVNWTVTLMPLKFLGAGGYGTTDDAIDAVLYAASFEDSSGNKVVRVTNNSWGGGRRSNALQQAIEASGALFVATAGNNGSSQKHYPAAYDSENVISVAATNQNDELAGFSNWSTSWVDLAAPVSCPQLARWVAAGSSTRACDWPRPFARLLW